jgi:TPR repeat protein
MRAGLPRVKRLLLPLWVFGLLSTACASTGFVPARTSVVLLAEAPPVSPPTCTYGEAAACRAACAGGDAPSCNNLGAMDEAGLLHEAGDERAADLYARACRGGATAGCSNAQRLASLRRVPVSPPVEPPAPEPLTAPAPSTAPAVAAPPVATLDELRARCAAGERKACDALPGVHISGNVHITGNVTMTGNVFIHGANER